MAKQGLDAARAADLIRARLASHGWSLCVGAGTSLNADGRTPHPFPLWGALVERLVRRADPAFGREVAASALRAWNPDALIQAARNRMGGSDDAFSAALAGELYADLRAAIGPRDWPRLAACLGALRPGDRPRDEWLAFDRLLRDAFPSLTALGLAEVVAEVAGTPRAPSAILSFNAEPLLYALLNAQTVRRAPSPGTGRQLFDRVTRSVSPRRVDRVPYVFCHGLLPIDGAGGTDARSSSLEKLVFSESEYLQLANTSFAWQSSVFLGALVSSTVFFLGLSMTDPNLRRWLTWAHANRRRELDDVEVFDGDSTAHYWIHRDPGSSSEREWTEHVMAHLGVRLIWVEAWTDVVPLLRAMLGLKAA